jgi:hypothetical protein
MAERNGAVPSGCSPANTVIASAHGARSASTVNSNCRSPLQPHAPPHVSAPCQLRKEHYQLPGGGWHLPSFGAENWAHAPPRLCERGAHQSVIV